MNFSTNVGIDCCVVIGAHLERHHARRFQRTASPKIIHTLPEIPKARASISRLQCCCSREPRLSEFRHMLHWTCHLIGRRITKGRWFLPKNLDRNLSASVNTPREPRLRPIDPCKDHLADKIGACSNWFGQRLVREIRELGYEAALRRWRIISAKSARTNYAWSSTALRRSTASKRNRLKSSVLLA